MHAAAAVLLAACGGGGGDSAGASGGGSTGGGGTTSTAAQYFPLPTDAFWTYSAGSETLRVSVVGQRNLPTGNASVTRTTQAGQASEALYRVSDTAVQFLATQSTDSRSRALGDFDILRLGGASGEGWRRYAVTFLDFQDFEGDGVRDSLAVRSFATLVRQETVLTPAGTFDNALLVRTVDTQTATLSSNGTELVVTITSEDWYAAGVGLVRNLTRVSGNGLDRQQETVLATYRVGALRSDRTPPLVSAREPAPAAVARTAVLRVVFNETMDNRTVDPSALVLTDPAGRAVAGSLRWLDGRTLVLEPTQPLRTGRHSALLSTALTDEFGNPLAAADAWTFDIDATGPVAVALNPGEGQTDVPLDGRITIRFDEPLAAASATLARVALRDELGPVPVTLRVAGNELQVTPQAPLRRGQRHRLSVGSGLEDSLGNPGAAFEAQFSSDSGRFGLAALLPGVLSNRSVRIVDANGDGRRDVMAAVISPVNAQFVDLLLWRQLANGGLAAPERIPTAPGCAVNDFVAADLDGDGRIDLAVSHVACPPEWLRQQVDGRFVRAGSIGSERRYGLQAVPIVATGRVALLSGFEDSWFLHRQDATGAFAAAERLAGPELGVSHWTVADADGDGLADIVFSALRSDGRRGIVVFAQGADGSFGRRIELAMPGAGNVGPVIAVDADADGRQDLLFLTVVSSGPQSIGFMRRSATGALEAPVYTGVPELAFDLRVGDFNGDGRPDLATLHIGAGNILALHLRNAAGAYEAPEFHITTTSTTFYTSGAFDVGDVSGDGRDDVLAFGTLRLQRAVTGAQGAARGFLAPVLQGGSRQR